MGSQVVIGTVTIANGESVSTALDITEYCIAAVHMPAEWDAADVTLAAAYESGGTYNQVRIAGDAVYTLDGAAADMVIILDTTITKGLEYVKLVSGTVASGTAQTPARTIKVALVPQGDC